MRPDDPGTTLTPTQQLFLDLDQAHDHGVVARHWEQAVWGDFDLDRFRQAAERTQAHWQALSRAHIEAGAWQRFDQPVAEPALRVTEAMGRSERELREILAREHDRLCLSSDRNLARSWQAHVLLTGPASAWVTVGFARVFFDRNSVRTLLEDLHTFYECGRPAADRDLSLDPFKSWAEGALAQAVSTPAPDTPPGPELPLLPRGTAAAPQRFCRHTVRVRAEVWARVRTRLPGSPAEFASPTVALAACGSVLALWSRTSRFSLHVVHDGRPDSSVAARAPGQFSRTAVAIMDESGARSFAARAQALHQAFAASARDSRDHAAGAAERAQPAVVFSYARRTAARSSAAAGNDFVSVASSRPNAALEIHAEEHAEGALHMHFDWAAGSFPPGVVDHLADATARWLGLLGDDAAWQLDPAAQAWRLFPDEQRQRRDAVNATHAPLTGDVLHSRFLHHVRTQPRQPAVVTPARTLNYGELFGYALSLARLIREAGVGRGQLVAIAAEKGWEQVAAAVGVSLSGAAYLPLDTELPADRMRSLVEHGEARMIVTQSHLQAHLPDFGSRTVVALDALAPAGADATADWSGPEPQDLAYVIFTSGSTGTPKGVMIDHRGAVNTITDLNNRYAIGTRDRVLALSRLGFDLSVYDIFGLLAAGGALVVPDPELARDPAHWAELVERHRVTLWNTVPALMQLYVDHAAENGSAPGSSLRLVWMSGDWIPLGLPDRIRAQHPAAQIISMGGATEASIWSILYPIERVDPSWRSIPYGKAMVNQSFHVLRDDLAPAPDYVAGELYIGGIGVALGYWRDAEKTRARFVVHPVTGERLYRTGDLGRYLPDGNIEFLGRADFQVKIRGFRIELGEIEAALRQDARIHHAVVVARGDSDSTRHLVAYLVPLDAVTLPVEEIQADLRRRLPAYMVPTMVVQLDRLPLTPNGKVDLKALPAPGSAAPADRPPPAKPTNEIEEIVLDVWRDVLGVAVIGIHDDFFALGGNSLSGTRIVIRLRTAFALAIPVRCLFENPTVQRLSAALERLLLDDIGQDQPTA